jgi:hypothetical protein
VPHETFWHMVKHFIYDITHFDSKFFDSMKFLLLKPGFLPSEYIKGKRASYLNPVKKYVFTSAVFFLIFFGFFSPGEVLKMNSDSPITQQERNNLSKKMQEELSKNPESVLWNEAKEMLNDSSRVITQDEIIKYGSDLNLTINGREYKSMKEYDSVQKLLPVDKKDNWSKKFIYRKVLKINEKYKNDPRSAVKKLSETFLHKLPYLLFVSLPLFALVLKLLYVRRKNFYYADHGIFSIYHYIFSFILLLFVFGLDKLKTLSGWNVFSILTGIVFLSGGIYLFKSMRRFYGQSRGKTFLKFLILNLAGFLILMLLFVVFILFSVLEI